MINNHIQMDYDENNDDRNGIQNQTKQVITQIDYDLIALQSAIAPRMLKV